MSNGGFVVSFYDSSSGNGQTKAQIYDPSGVAIGGEITLFSGFYGDTNVLPTSDGGFLVTFPNYYSINAQLFNASGVSVGSLTTISPNNIYASSIGVTQLANGQFAVTWQEGNSTAGDGTGTAVKAQIFSLNSAAVAVADTATISEDSKSNTFDVRANDTPSDVGTLTGTGTVSVTSPVAGIDGSDVTASIVSNQLKVDLGSDFDHLAEGQTATVVVPYTIQGPTGNPATTNLTLTVNGVNDAPVAVQNITASGDEDGGPIKVTLQFSDVDSGDSLNLYIGGGNGSYFTDAALTHAVTMYANFSVTGTSFDLYYVPGENYNGTNNINFRVTDSSNYSSSANAAVTVNAVNDAPVFNNLASSYTISENNSSAFTSYNPAYDIEGTH